MVPIDNPYVREFFQSLETWTDERFVTRVQVRALAMFGLYLVNLSEAGGWEYNGHAWKQGVPLGCLTVKATVDGIPRVAFTSARGYVSSVVIFMRKLEAEVVEWRDDKYRR